MSGIARGAGAAVEVVTGTSHQLRRAAERPGIPGCTMGIHGSHAAVVLALRLGRTWGGSPSPGSLLKMDHLSPRDCQLPPSGTLEWLLMTIPSAGFSQSWVPAFAGLLLFQLLNLSMSIAGWVALNWSMACLIWPFLVDAEFSLPSTARISKISTT